MSDREARVEIAVIEDEANLRELYQDVLRMKGYAVSGYATLAQAEAALQAHAPDLVLLDVRLPDGDGLVFLEKLRARDFRSPVVVITAFGTLERAVQALRVGAADFLVKPVDNDLLLAAVEGAVEAGGRLKEVELSAARLEPCAASAGIVGAEGGLREVASLLPRIAASDATVLVLGESGTGKEVVARALHAASPRRDGPFVSVNCAALPPTLLEAELFGVERGAFTGAHARRKGLVESAEGGTLFLDEIGDMALEAQARLLRVLQERELTRVGGRERVAVDLRVIAATHRDLAARATEGAFRQDLLYRLDVVRLVLPPLRERRQDIPGLIEHFLEKHAARHRLPAPRPDAEMLRRISAWPWPGNVRELENFVERAVVLGRFELHPLEGGDAPASGPGSEAAPLAQVLTLRGAVAQAERAAVISALRAAEGNKAQAARLLGVSYKTLFNKIHEHGIREERVIE